ncbi:MAG: hypothetical protein Q7K39_02990 [Candidatus Magasanikbacteria bacterium]|nr:hypothetical protein [Candidatus Magasanikbacteria bacterium]
MKKVNLKEWKQGRYNLKYTQVVLVVFVFLAASVVTNFLVAKAATGVPEIISHQGRLLNSSGDLLGGNGTNYCFRFSFYDSATVGAGTKLWPSGATSTMTVNVKNGVFNVGIGDVSAGGNLLDFDFQNTDTVYLNIEVAAQVGASCAGVSFESLSPRQRILASGYAINANTVGGFSPAQSATSSKIPVLTGDNLILGGTDPQINATGTNALVLQGGGGLGSIQFFSALNSISSAGALSLTGGGVFGGGLTVSGGSSFAATTTFRTSTFSSTTITTANIDTLNVTTCNGCGGGVSLAANNTFTGLNIFNATTTFTTTTQASSSIGYLNVTTAANFTGASIFGLSINQLNNTSSLAYLAIDQTFTGLNTFNATSTLATSTIKTLTVTNNGTIGGILSVTGASANLPNTTVTGTLTTTGLADLNSITSAGVLSVTGNALLSNLAVTGTLSTTGLANLNAITSAGVIAITGNARLTNLAVTGTLSTTGLATLDSLTVTNLGIFSATTTFTTTTQASSTITNLHITTLADFGSATVTGLASADLSDTANIALLDANQTFTGNNTLSGLNTFSNTTTFNATTTFRTSTFTSSTITTANISTLNGTTILGTTFNGLTITNNGTNVLTIAAGKTLTANNSIAFTGTDSTTMTLPTVSATLAGLAINQTFTGLNTFSNTTTFTATTTFTTTTIVSSTITTLNVTTCNGCGGGVSLSDNNIFTGQNTFNATSTFTTTTQTSSTITTANITTLNVATAATLPATTFTGSATFSGVTTDLTTATNEALTITPAGTGDLVLSADADSNIQITASAAPGASVDMVSLTNVGFAVTTDGTDGVSINFEQGAPVASSNSNHALNITASTSAASTDTMTGVNISLINSSTIGSQYGLRIINQNTAINATTEALITLDNAETTASTVTDGLVITSSGVDGGITDALDASASNITNALNTGINFLLFSGIRAFDSGEGLLTIEDTDGNDFMTFLDTGTAGNVTITGNTTLSGTLGVTSGTSTFATSTHTSSSITTANITTANITTLNVTNCSGCGGGSTSSFSIYVSSTAGSGGTWTAPAGIDYAQVIITGGGGGGGIAENNGATVNTAAGGGGSGGTSIEMFTAGTLGSSQSFTVGAGGAGAVNDGKDGAEGTTSTFGTTLLVGANPGFGGIGTDSSYTALTIMTTAGGAGAVATTTGDVNLGGAAGEDGFILIDNSANGGQGGASYWGGGGAGGIVTAVGTSAGDDAIAYGAGGGGSASVDTAVAGDGGDGASGVVVVISYNSSGGDLAEWYEARGDVVPGDLVAISTSSLEYESFALGLAKTSILEKAKPGSKVVGVVSTIPFQVMGGDLLGSSKNAKPIALAGRVPVNVSNESGPIKAGDSLTVSSVPGIAMRATKAGVTVGVALEDARCSSGLVCKVLTLVNTTFFSGIATNKVMEESGLDMSDIPENFDMSRAMLAKLLSDKRQITTSTIVSELFTDRVIAGLEVVTPKLLAGEVQTAALVSLPEQDLNVYLNENSRLVIAASPSVSSTTSSSTANASSTPAIILDSFGNGAFSGKLTAKEIQAEKITGFDIFTNRLSLLDSRVGELLASSSESGLIEETTSTPLNVTAEEVYAERLYVAGTSTAEAMVISGGLIVPTIKVDKIDSPIISEFALKLAEIASSSLAIAERIDKLDKRLSEVENNLANFAAQMVSTSSSSSSSIEFKFASSAPYISVDNLDINDKLNVQGLAMFFGGLQTNNIEALGQNINITSDAWFIGRPYFNADTAGFALVRVGERLVDVVFDNEYLDLPVVSAVVAVNAPTSTATSTEEEIARLFAEDTRFIIINKTVKGFTIVLSKPAGQDVTINWIALAVNNAKTFASPAVTDPLNTPNTLTTESAILESVSLETVVTASSSSSVIITTTTDTLLTAPIADDTTSTTVESALLPALPITTTSSSPEVIEEASVVIDNTTDNAVTTPEVTPAPEPPETLESNVTLNVDPASPVVVYEPTSQN